MASEQMIMDYVNRMQQQQQQMDAQLMHQAVVSQVKSKFWSRAS